MQNGIYNALFGAMAQEYRLDVIANNLANSSTAGFKRQKIAFKDLMDKRHHDLLEMSSCIREEGWCPRPDVTSETRVAEVMLDMSSGGMRQTGNPLDLAVQGEGFFKVETDQGVMYTRNGQFQLTPEGTVVTSGGHALLGQGGPVVIPEGGEILVRGDGQVSLGNEVLGVLDVVTVTDPRALEKFGENLFRIREGADAGEVPAEGFQVSQGILEDSNVSVVEEMVSMIETMRMFEAYQKVMTSVQDEDKKVIQEVGATR